jgi:hypothetical protein
MKRGEAERMYCSGEEVGAGLGWAREARSVERGRITQAIETRASTFG